jgi:DNA-binding NtrC family response regulator
MSDMKTADDSFIVGRSAPIQALRSLIVDVAPTSLPVLIIGPTGSGKELVAREIHRLSARTGEFVSLNVCAIQDTMFEATLFGHVKGAFTGAVRDSAGLLSEANGGSILLDEIGSLPHGPQGKLLRVIETKQYRSVGAARDRRSDFRVLAATNENLPALVAARAFRVDLLERLSGFMIAVPALRERREDIPLLVRHYLQRQGVASGESAVDHAAMDTLVEHDWPRNVRQLYNVLGRALALARGSTITRKVLHTATCHAYDVEAELPAGTDRPEQPDLGAVDRQARERLVAVLRRFKGDTNAAAGEFDVDRVTIYRWMKRLGIPTPRRQGPNWLSDSPGEAPLQN